MHEGGLTVGRVIPEDGASLDDVRLGSGHELRRQLWRPRGEVGEGEKRQPMLLCMETDRLVYLLELGLLLGDRR